ncbi:MAG: lipid-binding SYLF domain-containing protein [Alloacidobacterium sp.]|jgi:lipid-binding SYLF domain-containing protein
MYRKMTLVVCLAAALPLLSEDKFTARLNESSAVLNTITTKQYIPKATLDHAKCILVYPGVKKVGIGLGVTYGRGVLSCREGESMTGRWSPPAMYTLDVGSLGAQLGSTSTDYVLLVMTQRGAQKILSGKLKLGADATAVAGSAGAKATGTNDPNIDILSYSQSKGLFAGASLGSASLATDDDANKSLYGKDINATQIVSGSTTTPPAGKGFVAELNKVSPKYI